MYDDPRWRRLRRRRLAAWIAEHGPWCPGDALHDEHVSFDLTLDHLVKFTAGGARFDEANTRVICRSGNSMAEARS